METTLSASTYTAKTSPHRQIKITYDSCNDDGINFWKVIIDDKEHLFSNIEINVFSETEKNYISCTGWVQIDENKKLIINPFPTDKDTIL